jgi:hypothetical protein
MDWIKECKFIMIEFTENILNYVFKFIRIHWISFHGAMDGNILIQIGELVGIELKMVKEASVAF